MYQWVFGQFMVNPSSLREGAEKMHQWYLDNL